MSTHFTMNNLSLSLMETDPSAYLDVLNYLSYQDEPACKEGLKEKLNEKPYESWYSNHASALCLLVGKMNQEVLNSDYRADSYFGSHLPDGIDDNLGITILNKIVECGGDVLSEDYYGENVLISLEGTDRSFYRVNNETFIKHAKKVYENALN